MNVSCEVLVVLGEVDSSLTGAADYSDLLPHVAASASVHTTFHSQGHCNLHFAGFFSGANYKMGAKLVPLNTAIVATPQDWLQ